MCREDKLLIEVFVDGLLVNALEDAVRPVRPKTVTTKEIIIISDIS